jgi:hypothetical protein
VTFHCPFLSIGPGDCVGFGRVEVPIWKEELICFVDDTADEEPDAESEEEPDDVEDMNDAEVRESIAVVLLAKIDDEESQSAGMLLPSSSSKESGDVIALVIVQGKRRTSTCRAWGVATQGGALCFRHRLRLHVIDHVATADGIIQ